jgi:hypothetical protein
MSHDLKGRVLMRNKAWLLSKAAISLTAMVFLATACSAELDHESPFDSNAPLNKQARATLSGRFLLEGEQDHAGIEVRLKGPSIQDISTQADGTFAVNELIPGAYELTIGERGWEEVTREVVLDIGAIAALQEEELPLRRATLVGNLYATESKQYDYSAFNLRLKRTASPRGGANAPTVLPHFADDGLYDYVLEREALRPLSNGDFSAELRAGTYELYGEPPAEKNLYKEPFTESRQYRYYYAPALAAAAGDAVPVPVATFDITGGEAVVELEPIEVKWLSGDLTVRGTLADGTTESNIYSATRTVRLLLTAANASKMIVGEEDATGGCLVSAPVDFVVAPAWELSAGDGLKTVCVLLANEDISQTVLLRKSIILDTTAPQLSVVRINGGDEYTTVNTIPFELTAYDLGSGLEKITRRRNGAEIGTIGFVPVFNDTLIADGAYEYTLRVADKAGNHSSPVTASVTLDRTSPSGLTVSINGGEAQTSDRLFNLGINAGDADQIQLSLDAGFGGVSWQPATGETQVYVSRADGTISVYMRGRDGAGNVSEVVSDSITLDTTPPDAVAIALADIDGDGFPLTHETAELSWSASIDPNATAYELQRYVIGESTAFESVTQVTVGTEIYGDDITATAGKVHQYRVRVVDDLGQASQWSNVLAVNTMAADGQLCWVVNQLNGSDITYTLVPPTGAISSRATSSLLDMTASDASVVQNFAENTLGWIQTRRPLDAAEARFDIVSTNQDAVYRQQGKVARPWGGNGKWSIPPPPSSARWQSSRMRPATCTWCTSMPRPAI